MTAATSSPCPAIVDVISDLIADRRGFKHILSFCGISRRLRKLPILRSQFAQIIGVFHFFSSLPDLTSASILQTARLSSPHASDTGLVAPG
jgi:hypothetical protein